VILRRVTSLELIFYGLRRDLVTDSYSILARLRNHFTRLFNVHGFIDVRKKHTHSRTSSAWAECL